MNKRIFISLLFLGMALNFCFGSSIKVELITPEGVDVSHVQKNVESFLNCINNAFEGKSTELNFAGVSITPGAKQMIQGAYWNSGHFRTYSNDVVKVQLWILDSKDQNGKYVKTMRIERIPFHVESTRKGIKVTNEYQEASLLFDKAGMITDFRFINRTFMYDDLYNTNGVIARPDQQLMVWEFMERLRTAYNRNDIDIIRDLYSDQAIFITGKELKRELKIPDSRMTKIVTEVKYRRLDKKTYIDNLAFLMKRNNIHITFSAIENPLVENEDLKYSKFISVIEDKDRTWYGVRVRQDWTTYKKGGQNTETYHDTGLLFLLWEFPEKPSKDNPNCNPVIHVRTWQPESVDFNSIFSITDFVHKKQ